jgi:hypothetical protein
VDDSEKDAPARNGWREFPTKWEPGAVAVEIVMMPVFEFSVGWEVEAGRIPVRLLRLCAARGV